MNETIKNDRRKFAWLRIAFGIIWAIDAYLKWQPYFFANFADYLSGNSPWIHFWMRIIGINPFAFALGVALAETAIAIALLFGITPRIATWGGIALSLLIWSTAESFGGPYVAGSTDISAAIIYVLVFLALWFGHAWEELVLTAQ